MSMDLFFMILYKWMNKNGGDNVEAKWNYTDFPNIDLSFTGQEKQII